MRPGHLSAFPFWNSDSGSHGREILCKRKIEPVLECSEPIQYRCGDEALRT